MKLPQLDTIPEKPEIVDRSTLSTNSYSSVEKSVQDTTSGLLTNSQLSKDIQSLHIT